MGLFSNNNDTNKDIEIGDTVQVRYAGIEGVVVSLDDYTVMISYQDECDNEIVKEFMLEDVEKC